ncbi:MAG: hypothetical protein VYA34_05205 [Myxococcota bacterium]|nr:hypothetical protein [Myxococcota bacterium]
MNEYRVNEMDLGGTKDGVRAPSSAGFTLVDSFLGMAIFLIAIATTIGVQSSASDAFLKNRNASFAATIAQSVIEENFVVDRSGLSGGGVSPRFYDKSGFELTGTHTVSAHYRVDVTTSTPEIGSLDGQEYDQGAGGGADKQFSMDYLRRLEVVVCFGTLSRLEASIINSANASICQTTIEAAVNSSQAPNLKLYRTFTNLLAGDS